MEPITLVILAGLAIAAASAVVLWGEIVGWAHDALFPWVQTNIPSALPWLKKAFVVLDKAVVAVRVAAKAAWEKVKEFLLKQALKVFRKDGEWYRTIENWLINENSEKVTKVTTEEEVAWDELPDDVREALMRKRKGYDLDVKAAKDQEFSTMAMQT